VSGPSTTTPYSFIKRGNLFIIPVGPSIAEVPYPTQSHIKPREYSLWVNGSIEEPAFQLDHARMPPSLFQEVRNDLVRYSPVEVTRSAFHRSNHAYVGVIDSKGKPYYFALDSRGISVREAKIDDERVWKTFDQLAEQEHMMAVRKRRHDADAEMVGVDRELSEPKLVLTKGITIHRRPLTKKQRKGADDWRFKKALPKKAKETSVKKTPNKTASKKVVGAGGKPRYTYPNEKKPGAKPGGKQQVPLVVAADHDDSKHADPSELANQLGVSVRTLQHTARRLGRESFAKFMRSHLKRFAAKHRLDPDYWGTLYERLHDMEPPNPF
jgi:hypothetical protein